MTTQPETRVVDGKTFYYYSPQQLDEIRHARTDAFAQDKGSQCVSLLEEPQSFNRDHKIQKRNCE